jgi:hypothetical protein
MQQNCAGRWKWEKPKALAVTLQCANYDPYFCGRIALWVSNVWNWHHKLTVSEQKWETPKTLWHGRTVKCPIYAAKLYCEWTKVRNAQNFCGITVSYCEWTKVRDGQNFWVNKVKNAQVLAAITVLWVNKVRVVQNLAVKLYCDWTKWEMSKGYPAKLWEDRREKCPKSVQQNCTTVISVRNTETNAAKLYFKWTNVRVLAAKL